MTSNIPQGSQPLKTRYLYDPIKFFNLQKLFPAESNLKRKKLRAFLEKNVSPVISKNVEQATFPHEIVPYLKQLQICGIEGGGFGCPKLTGIDKAIALYELSRIDPGLSTFYIVQCGLVIKTIELLANEAQKRKYLKKLCDFDMIGCWGLTEPDYGSDATGLETKATPVKGGYLLTGTKKWIGNASFSDIMVIWAKNTQTNQIQGFIVDSKARGVSVIDIQRKLALRTVQNGIIALDDVFVGESDRLEKAIDFQSGVNQILGSSRMFVPWLALGIIAGVYETAVKYQRNRVQFGAPLASYQINQEKLVRILGNFNASFLKCWRLLALNEKGRATASHAAEVKSWVTRVGREAASLGRELLGGNGILVENYVMRALLDMEAIYTYEGTYDVNSLVTGRDISGIPAFKPSFKL